MKKPKKSNEISFDDVLMIIYENQERKRKEEIKRRNKNMYK